MAIRPSFYEKTAPEGLLPIGTQVRITLPHNERLPGGWANGVKSMISVGTLVGYIKYEDQKHYGVYIDFPHYEGFYTEYWCIEEVIMDNEYYLERLPKFERSMTI